jgi:HK97 family phage portal protein
VSLFARRTSNLFGPPVEAMVQRRPTTRKGAVSVTNETALRHSAVWAALRLRANLISTMPVDLYRKVGGVQVEVPKPAVLADPSGDRSGIQEWLYSSQFDLDRAGNAVGLITAKDGLGFPARIELQPISETTVKTKGGKITAFRIGGIEYDPSEVWHEKQYTVAGLPVGLSPVAYAAWSIGEYLSIQQFALDWFGNGGIPAAHLKNTAKSMEDGQARVIKERFKTATQNGDVFVTGADWEYNMLQAEQAGSNWLDAKSFSIGDIARFFDVPGDLVDAVTSTGSITYARIDQRNLQFLIMHLDPAVVRRETALSRLTPSPRYVKLKRESLLRMDAQTRATVLKTQIDSRTLTPNEARELEDRPPLTDAQLAEFTKIFGSPKAAPSGNSPSSPTILPGALQ